MFIKSSKGWYKAENAGISSSALDAYNYPDDAARRIAKEAEPDVLTLVSNAEMAERYLNIGLPSEGQTAAQQSVRGDKAPAGDGKAGARKMDEGKPPVLQGCFHYFARALVGVAWVSEYGDRKYVPLDGDHYTDQWARVPNGLNRYGDADARHTLKRAIEGEYDEQDSGLAHLQQKAWNALAELERALRDGTVKMMRGNEIVDGKPVLGTAREV